MEHHIKYDLYRYKGESSIRKGFKSEGFKFTYYFRKAASKKRFSISGIYYRYVLKKLRYKYGIQIPIKTKIGHGLYLGHFGMIVINEKAVIGNNCNLSHSITIGQTNRGKRKGSPIIGNEVWIGTGTVIAGNIKIGNNVLIAPNSFVNSDVPENSLVIGNPAQIIAKENPTEDYINYILKG
ncbi:MULTISPECIES: serine O-acetyltransferase [Zobellia]|uniref:serine O-acetyltransferase n=1 Tax=Zobellia TaxID=112040 RepID=UPI00188D8FBC|nr:MULTISPECIES: serine acetyltransferase [Zobellia]MBU2945662.1 serine acetyltransferase [Zobellia uliginosa]